jgi:hypothetical protein
MQFKHPELLYFLFVLVIPILVHLFQLRRFKKEYFTNVQFLKELSIQTRKSSKIKKWLLLITRLLLLAALITAFAQPFFKAKESKNNSNEMYIVLDNSYSMQAKGNKGELLKRAIQELLENTTDNQTFSLITNNESYWNTDIKSIQKEADKAGWSLEQALAECAARGWRGFKASWVQEKLTRSEERQNVMAELTRGKSIPKTPFWAKPETVILEAQDVERKRLL